MTLLPAFKTHAYLTCIKKCWRMAFTSRVWTWYHTPGFYCRSESTPPGIFTFGFANRHKVTQCKNTSKAIFNFHVTQNQVFAQVIRENLRFTLATEIQRRLTYSLMRRTQALPGFWCSGRGPIMQRPKQYRHQCVAGGVVPTPGGGRHIYCRPMWMPHNASCKNWNNDRNNRVAFMKGSNIFCFLVNNARSCYRFLLWIK